MGGFWRTQDDEDLLLYETDTRFTAEYRSGSKAIA